MSVQHHRILYKEDIDNKYKDSTGCIPRSAERYKNSDGHIDLQAWQEEDQDGFGEWMSEAKKCNPDFYNSGQEGCCYNESNNEQCLTPDNHTGLSFLGEDNVLGVTETIGHFCHKEEVQTNSVIKFFKLILFSILTLLITSLIATCYEFWFRYGHSVDCIYFKSKCANRGKTERISLVDYLFPNSICYYPYQACSKFKATERNMVGGSSEKGIGIISNFAEYEHAGAKCINLDYDTTIYSEKDIPYNIADFVENNITSSWIACLGKTISFYFLFTILIIRKALNWIFKTFSGGFQKIFKFNPLLSNLFFLLLTGLFFPLIAFLTGVSFFNVGPLSYLAIFPPLISFLTMIGTTVAFISTIIPTKLFGTSLASCNITPDYYQIYSSKLFYSLEDKSFKMAILSIILNLLIFLPVVVLVIFSMALGGLMSVLAGLYAILHLIFNIFYIPLSNPLECFSILKSHADLLTILFCISVIVSSANSFEPTTTGIMAGILMIIIVIKAFKGLKNSV
tara:strand:+ start:12577 stop:14103 length:1527 start_codon:yes stop_codon:yes gene_type:complete